MKILTSWDDACVLDMQLAELLDKYSLPATFYVPAFWESYATYKNWKPLSRDEVMYLSDKFEIGSHGLTHALLTQVPIQVAEYEIVQSKALLESLIGKRVTKFCYPRGYATEAIKRMVGSHYTIGRNTLVGSIEPEVSVWQSTTVHVGYNRKEYNGLHWYDYAIKMLERARAKKDATFHIWGHSHEIDRNNGWDALDRLMAEMVA